MGMRILPRSGRPPFEEADTGVEVGWEVGLGEEVGLFCGEEDDEEGEGEGEMEGEEGEGEGVVVTELLVGPSWIEAGNVELPKTHPAPSGT